MMITQKEEGKPGNRKPQKREPKGSLRIMFGVMGGKIVKTIERDNGLVEQS